MTDDTTRFLQKIRESTANKKYADGHTEHTEDCMSPWAEERRGILTRQTLAMNHELHMADLNASNTVADIASDWSFDQARRILGDNPEPGETFPEVDNLGEAFYLGYVHGIQLIVEMVLAGEVNPSEVVFTARRRAVLERFQKTIEARTAKHVTEG